MTDWTLSKHAVPLNFTDLFKQLQASFYEQNRYKQANAEFYQWQEEEKCRNKSETFQIVTERDFLE